MSAESPRKVSRQGAHVVAPQPLSDRSIIDNVAGFINEVVPQSYTGAPVGELKETISWARFEYGDINDLVYYPDTVDNETGTPPLLLVIGYGNGVQVWAIPATGEATEILCWRQGVVKILRILQSPYADVLDMYSHKRPLVALCDSASPGPQFCSLSFISLRTGEQVKNIKFKNPICDVLANRKSIVVTFIERIAVFDAATLEDRLTITTCYPCLGPNPNPVTLGTRWLAYAERKLHCARCSSGGFEGEGIQSYTATVLHAAKSFGKGLRELGESVASSLTGTSVQKGVSGGIGTAVAQQIGMVLPDGSDYTQPGIVTIIDVEATPATAAADESDLYCKCDIIAHFMAHSDPVYAMAFDPSGMLLVTADKQGHDFHMFRIQSHPGGSSLAAVHHLYILHRGDTTAKVQDIAFSIDSRWVAVSTMRGTTHVFPITPYGGPVGIRTHTTTHVVNRLSRFHRSAGLTTGGRNSPVPISAATSEATQTSTIPYSNPRLPPYPHPNVIHPLAQIRQPQSPAFLSAPTSPNLTSQQTYSRNPSIRSIGRTQLSSDDGLSNSVIPIRVTVCFAPPRAWLIGSPIAARESSTKARKRVVDSLFVMSCHGTLIEYDLIPKPVPGVPKEKVCDDTGIELEVQGKAQWLLLHPPYSSELQPPLPQNNPLMILSDHHLPKNISKQESTEEESWVSQVEIVTHAGPHRRLWMGPQFTFKTYTVLGSTAASFSEMECVEVGTASACRPACSNPVSMPHIGTGKPVVPVLIESGSASSYEQSPTLLDTYTRGDICDADISVGGDLQLKEDLADAMMESPRVLSHDMGRRVVLSKVNEAVDKTFSAITKIVNPVGSVTRMPIEDVHQFSSLFEHQESLLKDEEENMKGCITFCVSDKERRLPTTVLNDDKMVSVEYKDFGLEHSVFTAVSKSDRNTKIKNLPVDIEFDSGKLSSLTVNNNANVSCKVLSKDKKKNKMNNVSSTPDTTNINKKHVTEVMKSYESATDNSKVSNETLSLGSEQYCTRKTRAIPVEKLESTVFQESVEKITKNKNINTEPLKKIKGKENVISKMNKLIIHDESENSPDNTQNFENTSDIEYLKHLTGFDKSSHDAVNNPELDVACLHKKEMASKGKTCTNSKADYITSRISQSNIKVNSKMGKFSEKECKSEILTVDLNFKDDQSSEKPAGENEFNLHPFENKETVPIELLLCSPHMSDSQNIVCQSQTFEVESQNIDVLKPHTECMVPPVKRSVQSSWSNIVSGKSQSKRFDTRAHEDEPSVLVDIAEKQLSVQSNCSDDLKKQTTVDSEKNSGYFVSPDCESVILCNGLDILQTHKISSVEETNLSEMSSIQESQNSPKKIKKLKRKKK